MAWPFRRRRTGRHRLEPARAGVVLPGVALHSYGDDVIGVPVTDVPVDDAPTGPLPVLASEPTAVPEPAPGATVPEPRASDEPAIMPLPARVVLFFEDGTRQVVTPLSDEAERMRA
ncbi:MAG TPA: hypothetical protein VHE83_12120, partial [Mycobacteriales bacterium]|nr:hypothetical protein [Mycobacteriales bacterium]